MCICIHVTYTRAPSLDRKFPEELQPQHPAPALSHALCAMNVIGTGEWVMAGRHQASVPLYRTVHVPPETADPVISEKLHRNHFSLDTTVTLCIFTIDWEFRN